LKGLLVVGVMAALCTYGLAAERSAQKNQGATAQRDANQPGAYQPGTTPQGTARPSQMPQAGRAMMLHKTSELIGKTVKGTQGEDLGTIHDIVLTPDHQQVSYVALSSGGVLGIGGRLHAIPWQAVKVGAKEDITLSISKDQFQKAPSFSNDNWPSQADTQWLGASAAGQGRAATDQGAAGQSQSTADRAGTGQGRSAARQSQDTASQATTDQSRTATSESQTRPSRQATDTMGQTAMAGRDVEMRRVTRLTGWDVKNPTNEDLGNIEDFVVNASDGRVTYVILSFGGFAGIAERYAAVPANAVRFQPQTQTVVLNATRQTLESVAFKSGEAPNLASNEYMQRIRQLFPAAPSGTALGYLPPEAASQADQDSAWGAESRYGKSFSAGAAKTIKGTVESVGCFRPEGAKTGVPMGLRLRVRTDDGNLMTIHAGPIAHAEQQNFFVMPGDEITITGAETKIGPRSVIVASEIKKDDQTLQLRDQSGRPLWSMGPRGQGPQGMRPRSGQQQQPGAAGERQPGPAGERTRQP
jgi:sporulation protein YlmC with PRC-barrel domain